MDGWTLQSISKWIHSTPQTKGLDINKIQTVSSIDAKNRYLYCTFQSLINKYLNFYTLYTCIKRKST
jgi:hypothetical protein